MKTLIFGASGIVGSELYKVFSNSLDSNSDNPDNEGKESYEVYGTWSKNKPSENEMGNWIQWNFEDTALKILEYIKPDLIISSLHGDFVQQSTVHRQMADYLSKTGGRMVFISTCNVFDGDVRGNHLESALPYPISSYGSFKQSCEELLLYKLGSKCLVVRLPKIITKASISKMQEFYKEKPAYSNLYFNYNTAKNVANAIKYAVDTNTAGILHLPSSDYMSNAEFVTRVCGDMEIKIKTLSFEALCEMYENSDVSKMRTTEDGNIYLTLATNHKVAQKFMISCDYVIDSNI